MVTHMALKDEFRSGLIQYIAFSLSFELISIYFSRSRRVQPEFNYQYGYQRLELASSTRSLIGQSMSALPSRSDVDLLGDGESIIDLDAEIPDGALDLRVPQQKLDRPKVPCSPVDQGGLGPAQRVRAEA